jgi:hypothetical protein
MVDEPSASFITIRLSMRCASSGKRVRNEGRRKMGDIYVNGYMSISSFKVYRQTTSGGWVLASSLAYDGHYRFRFYCVNRAAASPTIVFEHVCVCIAPDFRTHYYDSYDYTGTFTSSFNSSLKNSCRTSYETVLSSGKGLTIYAYFIWRGTDGMPVNTYSPKVQMFATELHFLSNAPQVPLIPNVQ